MLMKSFLVVCVNRLGISYPELTEMQARAVFQAAVLMSNQGVKVFPEIMVPLVGTPQVLSCILNHPSSFIHNARIWFLLFYSYRSYETSMTIHQAPFHVTSFFFFFLFSILGTGTPSDFNPQCCKESVL